MTRGVTAAAVGTAALLGLGLLAGVAGAHHLGVYVPRDDQITASFKRMKVFLEQRRADLLRKEFARIWPGRVPTVPADRPLPRRQLE